MNSIILLGRTTSAIELKQTSTGKTVATFSLAVKRPFTKDTTDFHNVVVWDKLAETMSNYVNKGSLICISGYIQNRSWEDSNGNKRYVTEVVAREFEFCEAKKDFESNNTSQGTNGSVGRSEASYNPYLNNSNNFEPVGSDDTLPF